MNDIDTLPETGDLRIKEVLKYFPVSRSTWWAGIKKGIYPKPKHFGKRLRVWRAEDIRALVENGISERGDANEAR